MNYRKKLLMLDKKYIWHPFTQMQDWVNDTPLIIEQGDGVNLYDCENKQYIDGVSSLWVNIHGHRNKTIDAAIKKQLNAVAHSTFLGLTHKPGILLAKKLIDLMPSRYLTKVFYSDNGSTAVEVALKMAYQYWQEKKKSGSKKTKFLSLTNAYHGDTLGSVSVGGMKLFHKRFHPLLFDVFRAPAPYCYRCPLGKHQSRCAKECLQKMESLLKKNHAVIAGCIIEPMIQGAGGMIAYPKGYTKAVERLCKKYQVLFIVDEVATGFGRTGRMFACEHEDIKPDFICLSKGITGGYLPLAATITTDEVYRAFLGKFEEFKTFFHGHSYTANPLACAAALANISLFEKTDILKNSNRTIAFLAQELEKCRKLPFVGDIRQCGMMAGIEIVENIITKKPFHPRYKIGMNICAQAQKQGLIIRPLSDVIVIMPPLVITRKQLSVMMKIVRQSISFKK